MELIFLALLVLVSFLDASGRRKKKQRRIEDMEAEEAREGALPGTVERQSGRVRDRPRGARARRLPPIPDASGPRPEPMEADASTGSARRETADSMIPSDLWEVLTGHAPPERRPPPPPPEPEPASAPTTEQPTYETWGGEEVDDLHRPEPVLDAPATAPIRVEIVPAPTATRTFTSAPPLGLAPVPTVRRRSSTSRPASEYAAHLRAGGADSLRRAIVLKEILGPPPGLRPRGRSGFPGPSGG